MRDIRGNIQIEPSREKYFGETLRKYNSGKSGRSLDFSVARRQHHAMELYESRIGSVQRFVSMAVMFHQMGRRVETFFERISFGLLRYRMDRTHSIMRVATTASPVSGANIRDQMWQLRLLKKVELSVEVISNAWLRYKEAKAVHEVARRLSSSIGSLDHSNSSRRSVFSRNRKESENSTGMLSQLSGTVSKSKIEEEYASSGQDDEDKEKNDQEEEGTPGTRLQTESTKDDATSDQGIETTLRAETSEKDATVELATEE